MDARRVQRYEQRLRELNVTIPVPFDPWTFAGHVAEQRGRPITILPLDTSEAAAACGLWLSTLKADYVVLDSAAPRGLKAHILLHELAHMLLEHSGQVTLDAQALNFEFLDPGMVRRVLARTTRYSTTEERDAEGLASVLEAFAARRSPVPRPRRPDAGPTSVLDRFASAIAGDRKWL